MNVMNITIMKFPSQTVGSLSFSVFPWLAPFTVIRLIHINKSWCGRTRVVLGDTNVLCDQLHLSKVLVLQSLSCFCLQD